MKLTIADFTLLHLHRNKHLYKGLQASVKLTQEGIAKTLEIHQPQVALAIKHLKESGWIGEQWAYIPTIERRRKIYLLTIHGLERVTELNKMMEGEEIPEVPCEICGQVIFSGYIGVKSPAIAQEHI